MYRDYLHYQTMVKLVLILPIDEEGSDKVASRGPLSLPPLRVIITWTESELATRRVTVSIVLPTETWTRMSSSKVLDGGRMPELIVD